MKYWSKILLLDLLVSINHLNAQQIQTPPLQYPFGEPGSSPRGIFGKDGRKAFTDFSERLKKLE